MSPCAFCLQLLVTPPPLERAATPAQEEALIPEEIAESEEAGEPPQEEEEANLSHVERAAGEDARAASQTPEGQSRGQKRGPPDEDDRLLREIRDSMKLNTELLTDLVATKPSSARESFIGYVADTLRDLTDTDFVEAKFKIHRLIIDIQMQDSSSDEMPTMRPRARSSAPSQQVTAAPRTSQHWQASRYEWQRQAPAAPSGVCGSGRHEYSPQYHRAPCMPGYQPPLPQSQQPQQHHFQQPAQQEDQQRARPPAQRDSAGAVASVLGSEMSLNWSLTSVGDLSMASNTSLNTTPFRGAMAKLQDKEQEKQQDKEQEKQQDKQQEKEQDKEQEKDNAKDNEEDKDKDQ